MRLLIVVLLGYLAVSQVAHPPPMAGQIEAVQGLLERLLPHHADLFRLHIHRETLEEPAAFFDVSVDPTGTVQVKGTSGTELAAGVHCFLKERCSSSVSWDLTGGNTLDLSCLDPAALKLKAQEPPLRRARSVPWHYYQNVVTPSYSMTYWDWPRWEAEIDWMALHGINLPLAFTGQEYVWQKVWAKFGITAADLEPFFSGPSFLAWNRMGNLKGYGGPLPQSYIDEQAGLQRRVLARMRAFGMTPVLPAFAGFVPEAVAAARPGARITRSANWCGFPERFCCVRVLNPLEPLFQEIGAEFIEVLREEFGDDVNSFYSADTFNEMKPPSSDPAYLSSVSSAVYQAMAAADPAAKWLMQAWMFYDDQEFWQAPQIEAVVSGVPRGALVMLDVFAEVEPLWQRTRSFFGAPFIYCMLHNFGGNSEMYGALEAVASGPAQAMAAGGSSMVGVGMCPEGIEQNPVVYDLFSEWAFRTQPIPLLDWAVAYARRRYGPRTPPAAGLAWAKLMGSVYNATDSHTDHGRDIPTSRPGLSPLEVGLWGLKPHLWYNPREVATAWGLLLHSAAEVGDVEAFQYDLVDVGRQVISKLATGVWQGVAEAFALGRSLVLRARGEALLALLDDLEELLATNRGFLLGPRVAEARAAAASPGQTDLHEWNLRTQLTVWGTSEGGGSEVEDYANREWAGLIGTYYRPRWAMWLARLEADMAGGRRYDPDAWRAESLAFTLQWAQLRAQPLQMTPAGDAVAVSQRLYDKYVRGGHGGAAAALTAS